MTDEADFWQSAPKPLVELMRGFQVRDVDLIAGALAPAAEWTLVGRPDRFAFGGTTTRDVFLAMLRASLPGFSSFEFTVENWAQNGDVAFVETTAVGTGPGSAAYSNHYLFRFVLHDGLIVRALEHYDPFEALAYVEQAGAT